VLLVDDNPVNRIIASQMLARLALEVVEREDGEQALQVLREEAFDVVLMDCQMPVLDGPAATRALRAGAAGAQAAQLPIIAVTAYALAGDAERCLEAGMNGCLTKPYTLASLAEALKPWLAPRTT
jgi:CheY-like chemotaxis protein